MNIYVALLKYFKTESNDNKSYDIWYHLTSGLTATFMHCNGKCMGVCIMLECDSQALSRCRPAVALPWSLSRRCPCLGSWSRASPTPHRHQPLLTPRKLENISDMWHIRYYFISKLTPDLFSKVKTTLTILF